MQTSKKDVLIATRIECESFTERMMIERLYISASGEFYVTKELSGKDQDVTNDTNVVTTWLISDQLLVVPHTQGKCSLLRYSDIVDHEISIRRFFSEKAKRIIDNRTKAGHDARTIPLTPLKEEIIEECRRCQKDLDLESEYIFLTSNNVKSFYDRMSRTLKRICRKIGLPENSHYSGRRTFVSSLIDANVNVKTIMKYCGHLSAKTTLNNYCFDRSSKEQRRKKFENARSFMSPKCCTHAVPRNYSNQNPLNR